MKLPHKKRLLVCCLACALAAGSGPGISQAQRSREPVTLNFVNADIEAVARTMAAITGRNIVVDPRVKGTINLSTDRPVSPTVAYNQFLAALRLSGFTVVESGGLLKLVPEADAKLQGGTVSAGAPLAGNQIVTQIFRLNYEPAANLLPILRPLISPNNTINVNPGNNSLVITDYADNLQRLARIIAALDISNATDVEVILLRHALAADLAPVVQRLVDSSGAGPAGARPGPGRHLFPHHRDPGVAQQYAAGAGRQPGAAEPGSLAGRQAGPAGVAEPHRQHLCRLPEERRGRQAGHHLARGHGRNHRHRRPRRRRRRLPRSSSPPRNPTAAGASPATTPTQPSAQPSTGGQIQADPATNSLIITAAEPQYRQIRAVIDRLDSRRAQVYVESLIAEVNADKAAEFGIQWQGPIGDKGDKNIGVLGTNFTIGGQNIITLATPG